MSCCTDIGTVDPVPVNPQLLRILHLASPALPIGAFHFSQALEYAVEAAWVRDERSALEWIAGLAENALGTLDLPVLARLHTAWLNDDLATVHRWNAFLIAARETEELRAEDRHTGEALRKILVELGVFERVIGKEVGRSHPPPGFGYAAMFALACARWSVPQPDMLQAYAWAWAENQVLAAIKLVPLGQTAGQRMLAALIPRLARVSNAALRLDDDSLGACAVMHGMASARHELQYTRLFRS
jgi:urease accessory protein